MTPELMDKLNSIITFPVHLDDETALKIWDLLHDYFSNKSFYIVSNGNTYCVKPTIKSAYELYYRIIPDDNVELHLYEIYNKGLITIK